MPSRTAFSFSQGRAPAVVSCPLRQCLQGKELDTSVGNHGPSYCLASLWGLISGLRVPLPMRNGMQAFMNLPHVLWVRDLHMASGFQWSEGGMGQLEAGSLSHNSFFSRKEPWCQYQKTRVDILSWKINHGRASASLNLGFLTCEM